MTQNEQVIATFQTRVRQMILQFKEVKKENSDLYAMVEEQDQQIKQLKAQLAQKENEYKSLQMASMMKITDGDLQSAKDHVAKLIRDINKCITVLSDEK
ncbi:MAG: hypothetical protein J6Z14_04425 [Prevotella sp.]|nr:hypothetical protein [Prevotella sp.]